MATLYLDGATPTRSFSERHPWVLNTVVTVIALLSFTLDASLLLMTEGWEWLAAPWAVGVGVQIAAVWVRRHWPLTALVVLHLFMPVLRLATTGLARDPVIEDIPLDDGISADSLSTDYGDPRLPFGTGLAGMVLLGTVAVRCRAPVTWIAFAFVAVLEVVSNIVWVPREDLGYALVPILLANLVIVLIGINIRTRRQRMTELADRNRQLFLERDMREQLAVSAERARIAREMHDVVAHSLSVMVTLAEGAAATLEKQPTQAKRALEELTNVGRSSLADARRLVGVLREGQSPPPVDAGTPSAAAPGAGQADTETPAVPADAADVTRVGEGPTPLGPQPTAREIPTLVERFRSAGLPVEYTYLGAPLPEDAFLHLTIFRIVQEGLTNVLRHAPGSSRIEVTVIRQPQTVTISVDNDTGKDTPTMVGSQRGLIGIRERAAAFAGTVDAGPTPSGWLLQVLLRIG